MLAEVAAVMVAQKRLRSDISSIDVPCRSEGAWHNTTTSVAQAPAGEHDALVARVTHTCDKFM